MKSYSCSLGSHMVHLHLQMHLVVCRMVHLHLQMHLVVRHTLCGSKALIS
jgi:hypothetical protein